MWLLPPTLDELLPSDHINLTDQDARLMKTRRGAMPSFNAQAMVSSMVVPGQGASMLITAADVSANPDDHAQPVPMLEEAEEVTGVRAQLTLADAGYHSGKNLKDCARDGRAVLMPDPKRKYRGGPYRKDRFIYDASDDSYICPEGQQLSFRRYMQANTARVRLYRTRSGVRQSCPAFGVCTVDAVHGRALTMEPHEETLLHHRALMSTDEAKSASRRRGELIEPVFGINKQQMGSRRFALRGLTNVAAEWITTVTALNLRTLWRVWEIQRPAH